MLKAIDTPYKGYLFRSRTEARWAVFWDKIGLPFEYEVEGYDLSGVWYLPDFSIAAWDAFVEIKSEEPDAEAIEKCELLHKKSGKNVLLLYGQPWPDSYKALLFNSDSIAHSGIDARYLKGVILGCRSCDCLIFVAEDETGEPYLWHSLGHASPTCKMGKCVEYDAELTDALQSAFSFARRKRFESRDRQE